MIRVGLVEDNADFRAELVFHLRRAGFEIALESDGRDIDGLLQRHPCDIIVLDLGLPGEDGLSIASRLRQQQHGLGIVMLTARGRLDDRLNGLHGGADAYLVKPVDMRELVATLQSVQRRLAAALPAAAWTLAPDTLTLRSPGGTAIMLTVNEMNLLRRLAEAMPEPVSRKALAVAIGHPELDFDDRRLEVSFSRLRSKLVMAEPDTTVIRAVRGHGYVFAAPIRIE